MTLTMTSTFSLLALVVLLGCAHSLPAENRESVIEIAQAPNAPDDLFISTLRNVERNAIYHDWKNKLSVLKDVYQEACFIVDLDTDFYLSGQERAQIMSTFFPDSDMVSFPSRVGPFVEALCQGAKVFWPRLNPPALQPRPAINSPSTINGVNVPLRSACTEPSKRLPLPRSTSTDNNSRPSPPW
ncbi:uncharacterized protein LOC112555049 [Pomacea canaliculata]|uniref:uncharacterized protein LOC112555049 n=1 Tax=Pomacea canaliculata TaxID=400727 RepID=UPI000D732BE7|nr:uncharacterized protein LOC112555049 [Pomacea canaliculata]